jgi:poly(A) polymerase
MGIGRLIRGFFKPAKNASAPPDSRINAPHIIPRPEHNVSRANISENALKVLYRLSQAGHEAYLVGGGVRDLVLERAPKDFDVATSARPDEVKALFKNCRLIGRRFVLAHIRFGREVIEVATFRAAHEAATTAAAGRTENGMIVRDNVYGSRDEDAARRDLSINCLYYDIRDFSIVDFADGMQDLHDGIIRILGDPVERYREDPVRILRVLRFAAKLDFAIEAGTEAGMAKCARLLADIPPARLFEEVLKLFMSGHAVASFEALQRYDVLRLLLPATAAAVDADERAQQLVMLALRNTDLRISQNKPVTPAFLFAAMLWPVVQARMQDRELQELPAAMAIEQAGARAVSEQVKVVAIPKRFSLMSREIWALQPRLLDRRGRRPAKLLENPRLRAAYDFLLLRAESGEALEKDAIWWTKFLESDGTAVPLESAPAARRPRRRRRRRGPPPEHAETAQ